MDSHGLAGSYNAYYFATACGRPYQRDALWLQFFDSIAERIVTDIRPATVLDAGCAMGFLVECLRARRVDAFGIDVSEYAIQNVRGDMQAYCRVGSVTEPLAGRYGLIVCIEVLEHLAPREAEQAISNFCQHTNDILFSSTPFDYKEATHLNVQPLEFWAEAFARHNFFRDVDYDASYLTPWAVRFRHRSEPLHRVVRDYERKFWPLWKENCDLRDQLAASEQVKADILNSQTWRIAKCIQRLRVWLAPRGSWRERLLFRSSQ